MDTSKRKKIQSKMESTTAIDFVTEEEDSVVCLKHIYKDRAFQRKSSWDLGQKRAYILAANHGEGQNPIWVADIKSGRIHSEVKGKTRSVERYKKAEDAGYLFISLDGQNRTEAWRGFFNNEFTVTGTFIDCEGNKVMVDNKHYKDLSLKLKLAIQLTPVYVTIVFKKSYERLHKIFKGLNEGDSLNAQEDRNAINTEISEFIRVESESSNMEKMWLSIHSFNDRAIKRSQDAEWTAKAYMATLTGRSYELSAAEIDKLYSIGDGKQEHNRPADYDKKHKDRFKEILDQTKALLSNQKVHVTNLIPQKDFWLAVYVAERVLVDEGTYIVNYEELWDIVHRVDRALTQQSRQQMGKELEQWESQGSPEGNWTATINGEPVERFGEPKKHQFYFWWSGQAVSSSIREKRKEKFFKAFCKDEYFLALRERSKLSVA